MSGFNGIGGLFTCGFCVDPADSIDQEIELQEIRREASEIRILAKHVLENSKGAPHPHSPLSDQIDHAKKDVEDEFRHVEAVMAHFGQFSQKKNHFHENVLVD